MKHTLEQHWNFFAEFCRYEIEAGGPDPHMRLVGEMTKGMAQLDRLWALGCYVGVYNTVSAEVLWRRWPFDDFTQDAFSAWVTEHWGGISFRRERRANRTPKKLSEYLASYHAFLGRPLPTGGTPHEAYEAYWAELDSVKYLGRYGKFKLLEAFQRYGGIAIDLPDIRPVGADSPRYQLAQLFPGRSEPLLGNNSAHAIACVTESVEEVRAYLGQAVGLDLDLYLTEVMLCDYRQEWEGGHKYPGSSNDRELDFARKLEGYWGDLKSGMPDARRRILPVFSRGEDMGWPGFREDLAGVLMNFGYTWRDSELDYVNTLSLAAPVRRNM